MTALAPSMQAYFTDRLICRAPRECKHDRRLPPHLAAAARLRHRTHRASRRRLGLSPISTRRLSPRSSTTSKRTPQPGRDLQQPGRGDPLAVRLPRAAPPRTRRHDRARARDPSQTHRAQPPDLPHRPRSGRAARRLRPDHLDRPARPRDARPHDPDRATDLRADRAQPPAHHAHHRRQRPHHRQRKKQDERRSPRRSEQSQSLARRARRRSRRTAVPDPHRHTTQPRRHRAPPGDPPPSRRARPPVAQDQTHHDAHAAAHRRDAPASPATTSP